MTFIMNFQIQLMVAIVMENHLSMQMQIFKGLKQDEVYTALTVLLYVHLESA